MSPGGLWRTLALFTVRLSMSLCAADAVSEWASVAARSVVDTSDTWPTSDAAWWSHAWADRISITSQQQQQLQKTTCHVCSNVDTVLAIFSLAEDISLAFLHWVEMALHPWPSVSDIAVFVLKGDVKLELTN